MLHYIILYYIYVCVLCIYMYTCNTQRERERKKNNMLILILGFVPSEFFLFLSACLVLERLESRISLHPDARPLDFAPLVLCGLGGLSAGQSPMPNSRSSCYIISGPKNAHKHTTIHLPILDTQQRWQFFAGHCIPVMCRLTSINHLSNLSKAYHIPSERIHSLRQRRHSSHSHRKSRGGIQLEESRPITMWTPLWQMFLFRKCNLN
jgi:hypothetical protein